MPGFDKTGPEGKGPRTGRERGVRNNKNSDQNQRNQSKTSWLDLITSVLRLFKKRG